MLDLCGGDQVTEDTWHLLNNEPELPAKWTDFFDHQGLAPLVYDDDRAYHRHYYRTRSVMTRNGNQWAIFTKDFSRKGIGFYAREQVFPREIVQLWLPTGILRTVSIVRCLRVQDNCFECGAQFSVSPNHAESESSLGSLSR